MIITGSASNFLIGLIFYHSVQVYWNSSMGMVTFYAFLTMFSSGIVRNLYYDEEHKERQLSLEKLSFYGVLMPYLGIVGIPFFILRPSIYLEKKKMKESKS